MPSVVSQHCASSQLVQELFGLVRESVAVSAEVSSVLAGFQTHLMAGSIRAVVITRRQ